MFCSYCGGEINANFKFCPSCGKKLDAATRIATDSDEPQKSEGSVESQVIKKKMPFWFKLVGFVAVLALIGVTAGILFTESLVDVIDHQLEALREQDIPKAYQAYTSKDFQASTSLEQFRKFIEAYPVFTNNQSAHFTQRSLEHNIGTMRGNLTSQDHVNTPVEYKLIKEDDKWKILSIRLLKPRNIQNAKEASHAEDLIEVAKAQLKELQDRKLNEAYNEYSSQEFKDATSEEAFQEFVKRYPVLQNYQVASFHKPTIRNGVGTLSVILQSNQGTAAYIKYYLIYENQKWKIWSLRILSPSEAFQGKKNMEAFQTPPSESIEEMSFGDIFLGSEVNDQSEIKNPTTVFKSDLHDLYVDINVKNGRSGNTVFLELKHIESGSTIPAKAALEENGDTLLKSVFSPPVNGWPKGHYNLLVSTSTGLQKEIEFEIE